MPCNPLIWGIVSEYNPFHNGHAYLIQQARQNGATHILAVMSGNFVQRGEPALLSKWARTKAALLSGVDLVIELPVPWALSGAELFARGAVSLLDALGCVSRIAFGSECGDAKVLRQLAATLLSPAFSGVVKQELAKGIPFAAARQNAIASLLGDGTASLLEAPNNILGVEYCKAIQSLTSKMDVFSIQRAGAKHDSPSVFGQFASASELRRRILSGENVDFFLPAASRTILAEEEQQGRAPVCTKRIESAILYRLRSMAEEDFRQLPDISEGLENRLRKAIRESSTLDGLLFRTKSKRYSLARIRRIVFSAFLGISAQDVKQSGHFRLPPYLRVLGFNSRGREVMNLIKKSATLPLISQYSALFPLDRYAKHVFELENRADDCFALAQPVPQSCGSNMSHGIIVV